MINTYVPSPFRHKLTFALRVGFYADHFYRGTSYPILAKVAGINEQNISKLCRSKNYRLYHSVFLEVDRLGLEPAWNQYVRDTGLVKRIDDAAWQLKIGTNAPDNSYVDSGPGKYWVKNIHNDDVELNLRPYEDIKDQVDPVYEDKFRHGIWFKDPEVGWTFEEEPFLTIGEALRYFAKFPPTRRK